MKKKILALAVGGILSAGVQAEASLTDILITEYVEGSSYNKAIELTNFGDSDFTFLANTGISKQANGEGWSTVQNLEGTVIAAGETLVLVDKSTRSADVRAAVVANGGTPVISGTFGNGNDAIALADITDPAHPVLIDVVGVTNSDEYWGKDITLRRRMLTGDINPVQKAAYDIKEWSSLGKNDFSGLAKAELAPAPVDFTCTDANTKTAIEAIQGESAKSPFIVGKYNFESEDSFYVEGVVTAVTSLPKKGLYLQEADTSEFNSNGIFVETAVATDDLVGKTVCLSSKVYEDYGFTKLKSNDFVITDADSVAPQAVDIEVIPADGGDFQKTLERYEGMLVNLPADMDANEDGEQTMRVSRTFSRDYGARRDNISLTYKRPNMQPNQEHVAGSPEAKAQIDQNNNYRLILESNEKVENNGSLPYYPSLLDDTSENYIRVNDSVVGIEGVLSYGYNNFSLTVTNQATVDTFIHNTPRTDKPSLDTTTAVGSFPITIATQNVLNLFTTSIGGDDNPTGQNRGALSSPEYDLQLAKITTAIVALDTDIVGLMEIENNGFGDNGALHALVESINNDIDDVKNHYAFVGIDSNKDGELTNLDTIGTDAITTGLLYRPSKVTLSNSDIIEMPQQHAPEVVNGTKTVESGDNYQRDSLVATFIVNQTGRKLNIAVNHFKSKGSTCWEDIQTGVKIDDDKQGSCENFRVAAAYQLGTEFSKLPGDSVMLGDLNAYASEDPLLVLTSNPTNKVLTTARDTYIGGTKDALGKPQFNAQGTPFVVTPESSFGYVNIVDKMDKKHNKTGWSYSYNDEIGSLDHMLVNTSLEARVIDAGDWHINSTESTYFQYNKENKYGPVSTDIAYEAYNGGSAAPFRSSDHDPAFLSLSYKYGEADAGQAVAIPVIDNAISLTYAIPVDIAVRTGDKARITLTPKADADRGFFSYSIIKEVRLAADQNVVSVDFNDVAVGDYSVEMELIHGYFVIESESMEIAVAHAVLTDGSPTPTPEPTPEPKPEPEEKSPIGSFLLKILSFFWWIFS